ncbi:uncharacterized protein LOC144111211 [Amblyomma americanum]
MVLGRIWPRNLLPCRRGASAVVPLALALAVKECGYLYVAAAAQGFLASVVVRLTCLHEDFRLLVHWQGCASHVIWTLVAVQVDILTYSVASVHLTAGVCYVEALLCFLVGQRCSVPFERTRCEDGDSTLSGWRSVSRRPALRDQGLNSRLLRLALFLESSSRVSMSASSVSIQAAAILARVAFPQVVAVPCWAVIPSQAAMLVVRLVLEQMAFGQSARWSKPCGRWVFLFSGYVLSLMVLMLHFQTSVPSGDTCALHMMLAYSLSLACTAVAVRPVWETDLAGVLSAVLLAWPPGHLGQFDSALAWCSLLLILGLSAAILSIASSFCHQPGVRIELRRKRSSPRHRRSRHHNDHSFEERVVDR